MIIDNILYKQVVTHCMNHVFILFRYYANENIKSSVPTIKINSYLFLHNTIHLGTVKKTHFILQLIFIWDFKFFSQFYIC